MPRPYSEDETREAFDRTIEYWRRWLGQSRYQGRWREMVHRSALTLKLLTYRPTGAIVAAPTTSLPGAARRRAQLGLPLHVDPRRRLLALRPAAARLHRGGGGVHGLAARALPRDAPGGPGRSRSCTGSTAAPSSTEEMLDHLEGYRGSRPVRIGNGAARAAAARHLRRADRLRLPLQQHGSPIDHDAWMDLTPGHRVDLRELGPGRRGHLGGARRPQALHLLAADVVGGARARDADRARARAPGRPAELAGGSRDEIYHQIMAQGLARGAPGVRPALRHRRARRRACC